MVTISLQLCPLLHLHDQQPRQPKLPRVIGSLPPTLPHRLREGKLPPARWGLRLLSKVVLAKVVGAMRTSRRISLPTRLTSRRREFCLTIFPLTVPKIQQLPQHRGRGGDIRRRNGEELHRCVSIIYLLTSRRTLTALSAKSLRLPKLDAAGSQGSPRWTVCPNQRSSENFSQQIT